MNYSYVLLSEPDGRFSIGSTGDLRARLRKHSSGVVRGGRYLKQRRASWLADIRSNKLERH
jgi:predicted GIY-YIG superfamily endonuclease